MKCIYCQSEQVFTVNSRGNASNEVWRRKRCGVCKKTFTTKEKVDLDNLIVIKSDGTRHRYEPLKIFCGIYNAVREVKNMDRGKAAVISKELTEKVERGLYGVDKNIETQKLARIVMEVLLANHPKAFLSYFAYFNKIKNGEEKNSFDDKYWKKMIRRSTSC